MRGLIGSSEEALKYTEAVQKYLAGRNIDSMSRGETFRIPWLLAPDS